MGSGASWRSSRSRGANEVPALRQGGVGRGASLSALQKAAQVTRVAELVNCPKCQRKVLSHRPKCWRCRCVISEFKAKLFDFTIDPETMGDDSNSKTFVSHKHTPEDWLWPV